MRYTDSVANCVCSINGQGKLTHHEHITKWKEIETFTKQGHNIIKIDFKELASLFLEDNGFYGAVVTIKCGFVRILRMAH